MISTAYRGESYINGMHMLVSEGVHAERSTRWYMVPVLQLSVSFSWDRVFNWSICNSCVYSCISLELWVFMGSFQALYMNSGIKYSIMVQQQACLLTEQSVGHLLSEFSDLSSTSNYIFLICHFCLYLDIFYISECF